MLTLGKQDRHIRKLICETIPDMCKDCMSVARTMSHPLIKVKLATRFNHRVQMDLFFICDETFICLIDECIRYAIATWLPSKEPESILKAILFSWIQYFGPMDIIAFDQEGGITTDMAAIMCEKFNITRDLGGSEGHSAAPVAERRLALIKLAALKAARNAERRGIVLDPKVNVAECTMVTNHMLVYNGYSPSMALTGQQPRDLHDIENISMSSATGALDT
jgi:hypothetical protein